MEDDITNPFAAGIIRTMPQAVFQALGNDALVRTVLWHLLENSLFVKTEKCNLHETQVLHCTSQQLPVEIIMQTNTIGNHLQVKVNLKETTIPSFHM